jgi:mRNA-degrading endonuclease RelE of RelBE toxin-antitoxin system
MYQIEYTSQAVVDLKSFKKNEQVQIVENIQIQLRYEPIIETRNRKRMRPNNTAEWELRVGEFRVLYNVDEQVLIVEIQRVGRKQGNTFFFRGEPE